MDAGSCVIVDVRREIHPADAVHHIRVHAHRRRGLKWRVAGEQLEGEDAKSPPIDGLRVARAHEDLGRHVIGCAARGESLADDLLANAEAT
eukprot:CAMPEP_0115483528 /NCGR_PEP_ID=MMETSP0271-20121206/58902_1 /TAXON_ID=71861 /ORGANISM="Scrippsiella trochoidea, Strain CCMP3099" /LENGTH=90 /DNA_ID=CAMNT_0002911381 /DNA_START=203 /DNA_END=475 /DNA_ORIENTATION=+